MRRIVTYLFLLTTVGSAGYTWHRHTQGESVHPVAAVRDLFHVEPNRPATRSEVVAKFGPPVKSSDDNQRWEYTDRVVYFDGQDVTGWVESGPTNADDMQSASAIAIHVPSSHTTPPAWHGILRPISNARLTSASAAGERGEIYVTPTSHRSTTTAANYERSRRFGSDGQFTPTRSGLQRGTSRTDSRNNISGRTQWWR